jgi:chaperone required for assembly of F1-ATPase
VKRFWKTVEIAEAEAGGWQVLLDTKPVRTPARHPCAVPSRAMAERIAAEWDAQDEAVNPLSMPVTRAASTCLDRVAPEMEAVRQIVASYGETDLLCYRAPHPQELIARQAEGWDPWLAWAAATYGARLKTGSGVMHIAQDADAILALSTAVNGYDPWRLTALSELVTISGSLVLGLAVADEALDAADGWSLSRIDEQWNIDEWGEDAEAAAQAAKRRTDFLSAAGLLDLLASAEV